MDNVSLLKNLYAAFARGDVPIVLEAMSADIKWYQAEGNPYMPSGEAWVGPDSVLNNLFMKLGTEWDGLPSTPGHSTAPATVSSSKHATAERTSRRVRAWTCRYATSGTSKAAR